MSRTERGSRLEFETFDAQYIKRLAGGDPETESHFSVYFGKFLSLKLRSRQISPGAADDVRQETLFRVLRTLRQGNGIAQPERFGAFVNSVCNNVLLELRYQEHRNPGAAEDAPDVPDTRIDPDRALITAERKRMVAGVLKELSEKDREILRLVFFADADRNEISRRFGVDAEYLRVLLHRAKARFQGAFVRRHGSMASVLFLLCNGTVLNLTI